MKKILIIALLALYQGADAQTEKKYWFGATLGLNITSIDGHVEDYENVPQVYTDIFMEARLWRKLFLHTGIGYSEQGGTYTPRMVEGATQTVLERDASVNYIAIPVTARLYIERNLFFDLGVHNNFLVGSQIYETIQNEDGDIFNQESGLKVRPYDLSPVLGVGWRFATHWSAQVSLTTGRLNLFENDGPSKVNNRGAMLSVSYFL